MSKAPVEIACGNIHVTTSDISCVESLAEALAEIDRLRAQLADLRAIEVECDFEFLTVEVPKAFERTLEGAERVARLVRRQGHD